MKARSKSVNRRPEHGVGAAVDWPQVIFDTGPAACVIIDEQCNFLRVNNRFCTLCIHTQSDLLSHGLMELISPASRQAFRAFIQGLFAGKVNKPRAETLLHTKTGGDIPVTVSASVTSPDDATGLCAILMVEKIDGDLFTKEAMQRIDRALSVLSQCNYALLHAGSEQNLLDNVCQIITDVGNYRFAWVGYALNDEDRSVMPRACAGHNEGYLQGIKITWSDEDMGHGPVGTAIRTGKPRVTQFVDDDPGFSPWRDMALQRGYGSVAALPLVIGEQTIGALAIYAAEANAFDEEELQLLEDLSQNLQHAIAALRAEQERKEAERALHESYNFLNILIEGSPDPVFAKDLEGRYTLMNAAACQVLGKELDNIIGKKNSDLFPPELARYFDEQDRKVLSTGEMCSFEEKIVMGGCERTLLTNKYIHRNINGEPHGLVGISRDITERKSVEEALNKSHALYRQAEELGQFAHWEWDEKNECMSSCSEMLAAMLEMTVDEVLESCSSYENHLKLVHPDDRDRYYRAETASGMIDIEYRMVTSSGAIRHVHEISIPDFDDDGNAGRSFGTIQDITERKLAEAEFSRSKREKELILEAAGEGIYGLDLEGNITFANQAAARLTGWSADELIGKSQHTVLQHTREDGSDYDPEELPVYQALRDGKVHRMNNEIYWRKDGSCFPVDYVSTPIREGGLLVGAVVVFKDITEQKESEAKLVRYEKICSAITDAYIVINDGFYYEYANTTYLNYVGKSWNEVIGHYMPEVIGTERFEMMKPDYLRCLEGEQFNLESWRQMHDGRLRCMDITFSRFKNANSGRWSVLAVARDMTERKLAALALQKNEQRYRSLVEATQVIPWELDVHKWRPTYVGPQAEVTFGHDLDTWYEDDFWLKYTHPDDSQKVYEFYQNQAKAENGDELEFRLITADGAVIWVRDMVHLSSDENGRIRLQGIMVNITESVEKEAQLIQAQKMEAVGRLTGGIAHDFNNLLTIIQGNLKFLASYLDIRTDDTITELIDDATSAAADGAELTARLLAFSRTQSLKPEQLHINELIEASLRLLRRMIGEDISIRTTLSRRNPVVYVDPSQFGNALLNLVINARDAITTGGILTIKTGTRRFSQKTSNTILHVPAGSYATVTVTDNGQGMDSDTLNQACEPFFSTKEIDKGSGLGLSMVYGFVNQSGGGMDISSRPGKGTEVKLYLPKAKSATVSDRGLDTTAAAESLPTGTGTVLVVEDEVRVQKFAVRSLKNLGYRVLDAADAAEARKKLQSHAGIDLLFSDNILPGDMNGRELAEWARNQQPHLKVVLTTGFTRRVEDVPYIHDGNFTILKKPYSQEDLARYIRAAMDGEAPSGDLQLTTHP